MRCSACSPGRSGCSRPTAAWSPTTRTPRPWPGCCSTGGSPTPGGSGPRPRDDRRSPTSPWWSRCATGPASSPGCWPPSATGLPVVVVDDGSVDPGTTRAVAQEFGARLVRLRVARSGPPPPATPAWPLATTACVAFLDSDVVPGPGWLAVLRRHLDDPAVGVVGPRVLGGEPRADDSVAVPLRGGPLLARPRSPARPGAAPGSGGLPPQRRPAGTPLGGAGRRRASTSAMQVAEDVDLVWRLHDAGWRVRYEPAAVVRHDHRTDAGPVAAAQGLLRHRCRAAGRSARLRRRPRGAHAVDRCADRLPAGPAALVGPGRGRAARGGQPAGGPPARPRGAPAAHGRVADRAGRGGHPGPGRVRADPALLAAGPRGRAGLPPGPPGGAGRGRRRRGARPPPDPPRPRPGPLPARAPPRRPGLRHRPVGRGLASPQPPIADPRLPRIPDKRGTR